MSKTDQLHKIYRDRGLIPAIRGVLAYILVDTRVSPLLKRILGKVFHQKLWIATKLGYWPHIRSPRSFNEKLVHRKLFTDNERFAIVEDKYRVRDFVAERVGEDVLPELLYVTDDPQTIPFDSLPSKYVIKPTHLSDSAVILINENENPDQEKIVEACEEWLDQTHGEVRGEYWYSNIDPQILVEERLNDETYDIPLDYKFLVFHGQVKAIQVTLNRLSSTEETERTIYDEEWELQEATKGHMKKGRDIPKPDQFDEMVQIAETLGKDFDHIRVDLYAPNDERIVFGEMTVAEGSGANRFTPRDFDFELGSHW